MSRRFRAYVSDLELEFLVTFWDEGDSELAYREGNDLHWIPWSPPVELEEVDYP